MGLIDTRSRARRAFLLLAPAALGAGLLPGQFPQTPEAPDPPENPRLPNGKRQQDEMLREDHQKNVKDARDLIDLAKSFEEDLEKDDRYVLSVTSLKKLDDMEKTIRRVRGRLKRF